MEYSSGNSWPPASAWSSFLVVKHNGAGKRTMVKQFNYVHFARNVGGWHRPHLPPWPPPQRCRCRSAGAGGGGIPNPLAAVILGWPRGHGAGGSTDGGTTVAEYNWRGGWDGGGGVSDGSRGSGGRARGGCAPREATRHATAGLWPPDCRCPGGWGDGEVAAAVDVLLLTLPAVHRGGWGRARDWASTVIPPANGESRIAPHKYTSDPFAGCLWTVNTQRGGGYPAS